MEVYHGLGGPAMGAVEEAGEVEGQDLAPAAGVMVSGATAEGAVAMEVLVEEAELAVEQMAIGVNPGRHLERILEVPAGVGADQDLQPLLGQLLSRGGGGLIGRIPQEESAEGGLEQGIEALDIMAVAGQLEDEGNPAAGGEEDMLADATKPAAQGRTAADGGQPAEAARGVGLARRPADVYGMGIDDEKGGGPPSRAVEKKLERRSNSGWSRARRSAKFWRESRRGKRAVMVGLVASHN